ncbi:MAG: site-specific integrase [Blastocatellia bacterium]|nr:site-specific integrase [Blastocatellia bacterium]
MSTRATAHAGYLIGARLGELTASQVKHFNADRHTLGVSGKTGARTVTLSNEAVVLLCECAKGKMPDELLFTEADGGRRKKANIIGSEARLKARQANALASFYTMRHSYVSRAIKSGMPLTLIAENCGTSLRMIEKNYAHIRAGTRPT